MTFRNEHKKRFDDLDYARLRWAANQLTRGGGYSIASEDGEPMMGFVPIRGEIKHFVAIGWLGK